MSYITAIPADNNGNKLFLKDFREENNRFFVKYKSTYNDIPFVETEIFLIEQGHNFVITGEDGTILWRISPIWIQKLVDNQ